MKKLVYRWEIVPLLTILAYNLAIYQGSIMLTASRYHYDFTTAFDRAVPFVPAFVWIYLLAFAFWGAGYLLAGQLGKDGFYRFVATDLVIHTICLICFLVIPTTNVRPEITGNSLSEQVLRLVYRIDGDAMPSNLFPSIHCYVSWMCFRCLAKCKKLPRWYAPFSCVFAVLIIISTQVLKQHYIVDAIAGVLLVEVFWWFFQKGDRHLPVMRVFEAINHKIFGKGADEE